MREEKDPNPEVGEDIRILNNRENNWKEIVKENIKEKGKIHLLRWEVYMKEKKKLIKREF